MENQIARMKKRLCRMRIMLDERMQHAGDDAMENAVQDAGKGFPNAESVQKETRQETWAVDGLTQGVETVDFQGDGQQTNARAETIDYDRIAEAASQRPVVVYVDKKAAAVLLSREMDTAIGNRNIRQLLSMGG